MSGVRTLEEQVVPFFERHPLRVKNQDFQTFAVIVRSLRRKEHLDTGWLRTNRTACVWDERPWQATCEKPRRCTCRILRDCTPSVARS